MFFWTQLEVLHIPLQPILTLSCLVIVSFMTINRPYPILPDNFCSKFNPAATFAAFLKVCPNLFGSTIFQTIKKIYNNEFRQNQTVQVH